ncbi:glycosyltransferase [bacterium]|nr:glycosyltransferase [bacterium]
MKITPAVIKEKYRKGVAKLQRIFLKTEAPLRNVMKTNFKKHALVSYLTAPFKTGSSPSKHNNTLDALLLPQVLSELGYNVDVMNFTDKKNYDFSKYDVILGFGNPFLNSYSNNTHAKRIYYGTSVAPHMQNVLSIRRLEEFYKRHKLWLIESGRIINQASGLQTQAIDGLTYFGNDFVAETFRQTFPGPMHHIHNIGFVTRKSSDVLTVQKNWNTARNTFVTVVGAGAIHKGLDLMLELFTKHPEWELHIGAPVLNEKRFFDFYEETLKLPNIHHYGFLDISSDLYLAILDQAGFYISPSASEGCPTTVINAATNGKLLIIANKESGLESEAYIRPIKELSVESLEKSIFTAQKLPSKELEKLSIQSHHYFSTHHTENIFCKDLKTALADILNLKNDYE